MLYIIILSLVCIIIICIISCLLQNYHLFVSSHEVTMKSLPGPIRLPFIGGTSSFLLQKPEEFLNGITQLCKNYSSPFQFWIGTHLFIMIHEPDQAKTVLQSHLCLDKTTFYKIIEPIFGIGLLTAPASEWTKTRKIIASTFKASMLQKFFDTFVQESLTLTTELEKIEQSGNEIIFLEHIERCTIRISCASEWTKTRKIIAPTFKASMLPKFFDTFVQESLILTTELEKIEQSGNEV